MKLRIMLEWFLNPDHLPFIIGVEKGLFAKEGIEVELIQPEDHYDGFEDLKNGNIQLAFNEPIHMIEHYRDDILCLGSFFETSGGVMVKREKLPDLLEGKKITITTPAANPTTDLVAREILRNYFKTKDLDPKTLDVEITQTDFYHLKHLQEGYDAAWLCFENFEGVEARHEGLDVELIDSKKANFPNFSALEIVANRDFFEENSEIFTTFFNITNAIIADINAGKYDVKSIYYSYSKEEKSDLMDDIIDDSAKRFFEIVPSSERWSGLYAWFSELGLTDITPDQYDAMFLKGAYA